MFLEIALIAAALFALWWLASPSSELIKCGDLIPGPRSYPIFGNLLNVPFAGKEAMKALGEMKKTYGTTFRLWTGNALTVFLLGTEDIEVILKSSTQIEKGFIYKFLTPWIANGLVSSKGPKWRMRRKAITPAFHFKVLESFLYTFQQNADILVESLKTKVDKGIFEASPFINAFTLDVLVETAMGTQIHAQTQGNVEYRDALLNMSKLFAKRLNTPILHSDLMFYLSGLKSKQDKFINILRGYALQILKTKQEELEEREKTPEGLTTETGEKRKLAFLELLLEMKRASDPAFQVDNDVIEEVNTFMLGGQDTTAAALLFSLDLLAAHSDCQEKLYEELSERFDKDNCNPNVEEIHDLKYLDMFVKEVERFAPSIWMIGRQTTDFVDLPSGFTISPGALVAINIFEIHRNERWFPNPTQFNPDNFLPDVVAKRHPFAYIPFSAGPRNCIGQRFAMLELKTALIKLVLNFKVEKDEDFELEFTSHLILDSVNGHKIKIAARQ